MNKESICRYVSYVYLDNKLQDKMQNEEFKRYVDYIVSKLPEDQQTIMRNEYFNENKDKDNPWYLEFYSTATFYRLKNKTLENFLNLLNK